MAKEVQHRTIRMTNIIYALALTLDNETINDDLYECANQLVAQPHDAGITTHFLVEVDDNAEDLASPTWLAEHIVKSDAHAVVAKMIEWARARLERATCYSADLLKASRDECTTTDGALLRCTTNIELYAYLMRTLTDALLAIDIDLPPFMPKTGSDAALAADLLYHIRNLDTLTGYQVKARDVRVFGGGKRLAAPNSTDKPVTHEGRYHDLLNVADAAVASVCKDCKPEDVAIIVEGPLYYHLRSAEGAETIQQLNAIAKVHGYDHFEEQEPWLLVAVKD